MPSKTRNVSSRIIALLNQLRKVGDEEKKLAKQRAGIQKKIDAIRAKCPHEEKEPMKQFSGTYALFCAACGERV